MGQKIERVMSKVGGSIPGSFCLHVEGSLGKILKLKPCVCVPVEQVGSRRCCVTG